MTGGALARIVTVLGAHGLRPDVRGERVRARCPVHRDARPSLALTQRDGRLLMKCFAGCPTRAVLDAVGLTWRDLFDDDAVARAGRAVIAATYAYCDRAGQVLAEKIRLEPKAFRWRRSDPTARRGFRWGLDGVQLPLYRLPDLAGAPVVLVVEGEKAADALRAVGFAATCPPFGASAWNDDWTSQLSAADSDEIIVLPDNDAPGHAHAVRVATACSAACRIVKLIALPTLPPGGDVADFLGPHSAADLCQILDAAPTWTPADAERERRQRERDREQRRREKTRERVRRHRERRKRATEPNQASGCNAAYVQDKARIL